MKDPARLFDALLRAQECLQTSLPPWPDGVSTQPGISSRSVQAYTRLWLVHDALAKEVAQFVAADARRRWFREPLPVSRWRRCADYLTQAQSLARLHARCCNHHGVISTLDAGRLALSGLVSGLSRLPSDPYPVDLPFQKGYCLPPLEK